MNVNFYSTKETLEKICQIIDSKEKGAYFRFGDGDVNLALGMPELLQGPNPRLKKIMIECMKINHPNALKTLPLHVKEWDTLEEGMFPGNHEATLEWCENIVNNYKLITGEDELSLYSNIALSHLALQESEYAIRFLKKISDKVKYFIGNENIPFELLQKLFGKEVKHIKTPPSSSFSKFDQIYEEVKNLIVDDSDYSVIVTSMGCSGRAMQKVIWDNYDNFFLFDFGSLMDALCGWETRAWIELTNFDRNKFMNEFENYI